MPQDDRSRFADALEASQGMLSMSQETPRNIYGPQAGGGRSRGSADSYGFPATHSTSSSVSSSSGFGYYGGSIDSSVSDYSTAGSDIESVAARTLPRPQGLMGGQVPPAPQSMMGQFSSKVSSSTQKKHKCKVCDKRFTRPSSLQTHMYSHTGEKRKWCFPPLPPQPRPTQPLACPVFLSCLVCQWMGTGCAEGRRRDADALAPKYSFPMRG